MPLLKNFPDFAFPMPRSLMLIAAGMCVFAASVTLTLNNPQAAHAETKQDCSTNSIIKCGVTSADDFAQKVKTNKTGDLDAIYNLSDAQFTRFKKEAVKGWVYDDGRITVAGKTVGTKAQSLGREYLPGSTKKVIGGKTYWLRPTSVSFASSPLEALVVLNSSGQAEAVLIMACGNPVTFTPPPTPPKPAASAICKALIPLQITRETYQFYSSLPLTGDARLIKVTYNFGDGTPPRVEAKGETKVSHTFKPGTYTITATASFTVNGQSTSKSCTTQITVKAAPTKPTPIPATVTPPTITPTSTPTPPKKEETPSKGQELPATGAETLGGLLGVSSLAGVGYYWRSSRRDLIDRILNRQ